MDATTLWAWDCVRARACVCESAVERKWANHAVVYILMYIILHDHITYRVAKMSSHFKHARSSSS